ncbi:unnamed protein product [Medioppia subpectinata]|uniref:Uncharacterized protein n=1 Tax=Medioppia subpectinata TaxID=1979941 RepID=A0A7R9KE06_9ACAR|nr:unnamed protein product [Medioppia subpectinata]CAG2101582.1 unnamed protein product [Medioppia subpectinata]
MAFSNQKLLTILKIVMSIHMTLANIYCIYIIVVWGMALGGNETGPDANTVDKQKVTIGLVITVVGLLVGIIGLVGVIRESKCIVIMLLVVTIAAIIANFAMVMFVSAVWGIVVAAVTAVYLYLIIQKEKETDFTDV